MLSLLLEALDQTIVGAAMPRIIAELHDMDRSTWVVTAYVLASWGSVYGVSNLFGPTLGDWLTEQARLTPPFALGQWTSVQGSARGLFPVLQGGRKGGTGLLNRCIWAACSIATNVALLHYR